MTFQDMSRELDPGSLLLVDHAPNLPSCEGLAGCSTAVFVQSSSSAPTLA